MKQILKKILLFGSAIAIFTACGDGTSSGVSSNGTLVKGEFTVARGKKVYFSRGNLQYQASTGTWRFAEHQWDMIGENNENISSDYDGWIDLFGWGTSGYNGKYPYMTSIENTDYGDGMNDIAVTDYDWGVYNKILNGGNKAGLWRTLTYSEWRYILNDRPHCENLYSKGCVDSPVTIGRVQLTMATPTICSSAATTSTQYLPTACMSSASAENADSECLFDLSKM